MIEHVRRTCDKRNRMSKGAIFPRYLDPQYVLRRIHVFRVHSISALIATVRELPIFIESKQREGGHIRLVVIDSFAFHFRVSFVVERSCSYKYLPGVVLIAWKFKHNFVKKGYSPRNRLDYGFQTHVTSYIKPK